MLIKKMSILIIVLFFISINSYAQTILTTFNPNNVTKVSFDGPYESFVPWARPHYNTQKINLPDSFFFGDNTSRNPGACNWIKNNYNFRIGYQASLEYIVSDGRNQYVYYIEIFRESANYYVTDTARRLSN